MIQTADIRSPTPADLQIQELLSAAAFPHPVTGLTVQETHISWVILTGRYAYKIKKPVRFDFIDASTLGLRRHYCEEELRLNRRLAPELYEDVVAITREDGKVRIGGTGAAIEYAVRMKQFGCGDELLSLLRENKVSLTEATALGELIARFHTSAAIAPWTDAHEKTHKVYAAVLGNLAQLIAHLRELDAAPALGRLVDWTHDAVCGLERTFQMRERAGCIRECHGDLHAGNIVRSQGRLVPFDCLEFNPQLRWIDVISDVAFLVMDLVSHGRADLAYALLSRYLEVTGDYEGLQVLPFYAVYRALVRAKVDALTAEQVPARAPEFHQRLLMRVRAAASWIEPRRPLLAIMHGPSGSGKSWLSERLVTSLHAIRVRSDLERKRLAGIQPGANAAAPVEKGIYAADFNHRTYSRLEDCAASALQAGINVIVDASFLNADDRALFHRLARQQRASFVIVSCQGDPIALAARTLNRSKQGGDPSDADLGVLDAQLRSMTAFTVQEQEHVIALSTDEANAVERVTAAIERRRDV